jgi:glycerol uptake facilitator-like aquaporin
MSGADNPPSLALRLASEAIGSAFLLAIVVGSGIMAERLSGGNAAIALLANALATGAGLYALITALAPVSSHFNPAVTLFAAARGEVSWREVPLYATTQVLAAIVGVGAAHAMFAVDVIQLSTKARTGGAQLFAEWVATLGLLLVIAQVARYRRDAIAASVACYITAAYWFTASTSFANPAVTLARGFSESFAGIRLADVPGFVLAQLLAIPAALVIVWLLSPRVSPSDAITGSQRAPR